MENLRGDILLIFDDDAAGVDQFEMPALVFGLPVEAVARDAGLVADNRAPLSSDSIEECGLSNVGPAHNDHCGNGIGHVSLNDSRAIHGNVLDMGDVATPLDGLFEPFSRCFDVESAQRIAEFRIDAAVQARVDLLAERANAGILSDEEQIEYEAFINVADFISILKLKARRQLESDRG